jgi:hypothetical protein
MKSVLIFGNGNLSLNDFLTEYLTYLDTLDFDNDAFIVGDFRGADTLALEYLKTKSANVKVFHVGERPRYFPDKFKTKVGTWKTVGGFRNDAARDLAMIQACTHFIGVDYNSDENRVSGTAKNIQKCRQLDKIDLRKPLN